MLILHSLIILAVVASLLVSSNLLYMYGWDYAASVGSPLLKIHPSTYLVFLCVMLSFFVIRPSTKIRNLTDRRIIAYVMILMALIIFCAIQGYVLTVPIVTLVMPVLLYYLFQHTGQNFRLRVGQLIRVLVAVNGAIGIFELIRGETFLPRVVGDLVVQQDLRPIGFVGHPLTSALLSGLVLVYLVPKIRRARLTVFNIGEIALAAASLVAFGSRLALVVAAALVIWELIAARVKSRVTGRGLLLRGFIFIGLLAFGYYLITSDFGSVIVARFSGEDNAQDSTETRFSILPLLQEMSATEWIKGVSSSRRTALQESFGTEFGVEMTWASWILSFGIIWTAILIYGLLQLLYRSLSKIDIGAAYMIIFFLICITGSQGLGGKTLILSWLVSMLLCFVPQQARRIEVKKKTTRDALITQPFRVQKI